MPASSIGLLLTFSRVITVGKVVAVRYDVRSQVAAQMRCAYYIFAQGIAGQPGSCGDAIDGAYMAALQGIAGQPAQMPAGIILQ